MDYCSLYKHRTKIPTYIGRTGNIYKNVFLEALKAEDYPYSIEWSLELTFKCCTLCDCNKSTFNDKDIIVHPRLRTKE